MNKWVLQVGTLSFEDCKALEKVGHHLEIADSAKEAIHHSVHCVDMHMANKKTVYGVNTGFGLLADTIIPENKLPDLQTHLLLSHATGVGELLADEVVRLILALKINSLARGYSGVRLELIEALMTIYNHNLLPCIPSQGSVGASGDLAPLAHCFLMLSGYGKVKRDEQWITGKEALEHCGLTPITLAPKEGLALLNGTQVSTAIALSALIDAEMLLQAACVLGAFTSIALQANKTPFDSRIHAVRGQLGQMDVAQELSRLVAPCEYTPRKVQDPYSLRCQPQVIGACLDALRYCKAILMREVNAVSDNPLVFGEDNEILSGGNFHAQPVAFAADHMALAIAEMGSLCERRIALMIDKNMSGLPAFLVRESGLHSGFMIAHVTAAALVSENKHLANPTSVDSIPTSGNQEDHVSMATHGALRLHKMIKNLRYIFAIEYLAASQACLLQKNREWPAPFSALVQQVQELFGEYRDEQVLGEHIELLATSDHLSKIAAFSEINL